MNLKKISLKLRILLGYFIVIAVVSCMTAILFYERAQMQSIKLEFISINDMRHNINVVHRHITELAVYGESVINWQETDYQYYCTKRLHTDSLLCAMKQYCLEYVNPEQIDSLRNILAGKEKHLLHVMESFDRQKQTDSLLINHLPEVAKRATRIRTIQQKKKGIAGLFGGKQTVHILPSAKELHEFNDSLIVNRQEQTKSIVAYVDSLSMRNNILNNQLNALINDLDEEVQTVFIKKAQKIAEAQNLSVRLYTATIAVAIILLFLSYLTIHRELKRNANEKKKREKLIGELQVSDNKNKELIRLRRNLIQNVSHELRTPLTAIIGNAELVLQDKEDAERRYHTEAIRESAGRMAFMINNLLEYFRLDNGKVTINPRPFKLNTIAETLEMEFTPLAEAKKLTLNVNSHAVEVVTGDKNRILNIGSNLLSNAIKFTQKGTVVLTTTYRNGQFSLVVEDSGTGISEDKRDEIFKPFERLGNAVTQDGFGLGLSIVKQLVGLMKGSILLESVQGKGSRFTVTLPLPEAEQVADGTERIERRSVPDCSIILLDNDRVILDMMRGMLVQNGANCDACLTVGELTDKMRDKDYDLLITDLKMPEMNGYEVLELLRTSEIGNSRTIPVVAATAAGYITQEELVSQGFTAMLPKPFSIGELLDVIGMYVRKNPRLRPDLSPLLAFGDGKRTLERLASETEKEMDEVLKAAEAKDMEALDGWVHHLRSSWMLMKAEQPLMVLYEAIHKENISESEVNAAVSEVLAQGRLIMELARKEAEQWEE